MTISLEISISALHPLKPSRVAAVSLPEHPFRSSADVQIRVGRLGCRRTARFNGLATFERARRRLCPQLHEAGRKIGSALPAVRNMKRRTSRRSQSKHDGRQEICRPSRKLASQSGSGSEEQLIVTLRTARDGQRSAWH